MLRAMPRSRDVAYQQQQQAPKRTKYRDSRGAHSVERLIYYAPHTMNRDTLSYATLPLPCRSMLTSDVVCRSPRHVTVFPDHHALSTLPVHLATPPAFAMARISAPCPEAFCGSVERQLLF